MLALISLSFIPNTLNVVQMVKRYLILLLCLALSANIHVIAQGGGIDTSFGVNGLIIIPGSGYNVTGQQSLGNGSTLIYEYNTQSALERVCKYNASGNLINSFGNNGCIITSNKDSAYTLGSKILLPKGGFLTVKQMQLNKSIVMLDSNWSIMDNFNEIFFQNSVNPLEKILGIQSDGKILVLLGNGNIKRYSAMGVFDSSFKYTLALGYPILLSNNKLIIKYGDTAWMLETNGAIDSLFNGFDGLPLVAKWTCTMGPRSAPKQVVGASYNKFTHEYLLNFLWDGYFCPTSPNHTYTTETISFKDNGDRIDISSFYESSQRMNQWGGTDYSNYKTCIELSDKTYLFHSVSFTGFYNEYNYTITRVNMDCLFGVPSIGKKPFQYFRFTKINEHQLLWVRSFADTIYISRVNIVLMPLAASFTANITRINIGDTIKFTPDINRAVSRYEWNINTPFCFYLNGTDSTCENPVVKFNTAGKYDIQLKLYLEDTIIVITKEQYIEVLPAAGLNQSIKSSLFIYPNPSKSFIVIESYNSLMGAQCNVYDIQGRLIQNQSSTTDDKWTIILPENPGVFFLKINTSDGKQWVRKVVKE